MSDGKGCKCAARCEADCACGADWTPQIQIDLKRELADLRCRLENVRDIASVRESQRDNWKKRTESAERRLAEAEQELKHRCVCRFTSGGVLKKTLCEFHQRLQNKAERASFVKAALAIAGKRSKAPPSVQGDYFVGFNDGIDAGTAAIRALIPKEADRG